MEGDAPRGGGRGGVGGGGGMTMEDVTRTLHVRALIRFLPYTCKSVLCMYVYVY
jgi:hypothetical protein